VLGRLGADAIPVKEFWSVIIYSNQTRSMLQTDQQFPSVSSQTRGLLVNADKSADVYFGPTAPPGKEKNWVQTIPGKGFNVWFCLYGPLEPWFDKPWRPGEIEVVAPSQHADIQYDGLTLSQAGSSAGAARLNATDSQVAGNQKFVRLGFPFH
jgi:hypothetical protein